jgi:hypothetical protein
VFGRLTVGSALLSQISGKLYNIRSKMVSSEQKSENMKNRDFVFHQKEFRNVLIEIGQQFYPNFVEPP